MCVPKRGETFRWDPCKCYKTPSNFHRRKPWPTAFLFGHSLPATYLGNFLGRGRYHIWGGVKLGSLRSEFWGVAVLLRNPLPSLMWFSCFWKESFRTWNSGHAGVPRRSVHWGREVTTQGRSSESCCHLLGLQDRQFSVLALGLVCLVSSLFSIDIPKRARGWVLHKERFPISVFEAKIQNIPSMSNFCCVPTPMTSHGSMWHHGRNACKVMW